MQKRENFHKTGEFLFLLFPSIITLFISYEILTPILNFIVQFIYDISNYRFIVNSTVSQNMTIKVVTVTQLHLSREHISTFLYWEVTPTHYRISKSRTSL